MKITFLGTGANGGTPQIDCSCNNCSLAIKNKAQSRLRSSLLIETKHHKIILDCGPDFRQQVIKANLKLQEISLIAITHFHPDHSSGINELGVGQKLKVPVLFPKGVGATDVKKNIFPGIDFLQTSKFINVISEAQAKRFGTKLIQVPHSDKFPTSAILVREGSKRILYCPDVFEITPAMKSAIKEVDLLIFDATFLDEKQRPASKLGHLTIEKSAPELARLGTKVVFSHLNHTENVEKIQSFIKPFGFSLANDLESINL